MAFEGFPVVPLLHSLPSPTKIREELERMVLNDLLGPVGGPEEEIDEQSVRDRYLVGMLAPKRQELSPEEFDELSQGGSGSVEDGATESSSPTTKTMFPSSFGMTFCVGLEAKALQITARWGHYHRDRSETLTTKSGDKKLVWKRTQREAVSEAIPLKVGRLNWTPDAEFPEVQVQGLVRKRDDFWSVTLFLVNGQQEPKKLRDSAWVFQPELIVESPGKEAIFHSRPQQKDPGKSDPVTFAEEQEMAMLYRHHVEFGVGHGVSIHADCPDGICDKASRLSTRVVPTHEVPQTTPPTTADWPKLAGLVLDMKELGETPTSQIESKLRPLLTAYDAWIKDRQADLRKPDMALYQKPGQAALNRCQVTLQRIEAGLKLLLDDEKAAEAFRFANLAMWQQRIHTIISLRRRRDEPVDERAIDVPDNRSWYPFQLAFILLNLPGITRLDHKDRTSECRGDGRPAVVPHRRRQDGGVPWAVGLHDGPAAAPGDGGRSLGRVRRRRADAVHAAAADHPAVPAGHRPDLCLRGDPARPTRRHGARNRSASASGWDRRRRRTRPMQAAEAIQQEHGGKYKGRGSGSPAQLTNCPWCGAKINAGQHIKVESYTKGRCRTVTYCGDVLGRCPFSAKNSPLEGIPVLVVDEEIYRRLPTLLIATVDKFAQMPWNGKVQMLFGQVDGYCDRHGFRSPEIEDADSHPKKDKHSPAKTRPHAPVRPPDLIIQDELHLISGPLGTLVGLYETAVDKLCSWEVNGKTVRPKVIASTATIRKAGDQVHATFLRKVNVFPPNGLDVRDNFFALQRTPYRGLARSPIHRHLCARAAAEGGPDPGLRGPAVRRPDALREEGLRQGGGPVDDADRLLQLDAGTGRDAAARR